MNARCTEMDSVMDLIQSQFNIMENMPLIRSGPKPGTYQIDDGIIIARKIQLQKLLIKTQGPLVILEKMRTLLLTWWHETRTSNIRSLNSSKDESTFSQIC